MILGYGGLVRAIVVTVIVQFGVGQKWAAFGELTRACHDGYGQLVNVYSQKIRFIIEVRSSDVCFPFICNYLFT